MSYNFKNIYKNDNLTNFIIFLTIILIIGYLADKNYEAIIFLFISSVFLFLLCKNINYSIGISILLTNLFISFNFFKVTENFFNNDQMEGIGKSTTYFMYGLNNFINKGIDDRINLRLGQLGKHLAKEDNLVNKTYTDAEKTEEYMYNRETIEPLKKNKKIKKNK